MDTQENFISKEMVEKRLYKLIGCQKSDSKEIDLIVDLVSSFYENYQRNMHNIFNDKLSFNLRLNNNNIHFNNVFFISKRDLVNIYYFNTSEGEFRPNTPDTFFVGATCNSSLINTKTSICPEQKHIKLLCSENKDFSQLQMIIKDYLYLNMYSLEEFYQDKTQDLKKILSPIADIIFLLEKNNIDISDFLKSETLYSKKEIYDIFESNKEIIMLSTDQSIEKELFLLKKSVNYNQKNNL